MGTYSTGWDNAIEAIRYIFMMLICNTQPGLPATCLLPRDYAQQINDNGDIVWAALDITDYDSEIFMPDRQQV